MNLTSLFRTEMAAQNIAVKLCGVLQAQTEDGMFCTILLLFSCIDHIFMNPCI